MRDHGIAAEDPRVGVGVTVLTLDASVALSAD